MSLEDLGRVRDMLETRHKIVTKLIRNPASIRLCIPFYMTDREAERAVGAIRRTFMEILGT